MGPMSPNWVFTNDLETIYFISHFSWVHLVMRDVNIIKFREMDRISQGTGVFIKNNCFYTAGMKLNCHETKQYFSKKFQNINHHVILHYNLTINPTFLWKYKKIVVNKRFDHISSFFISNKNIPKLSYVLIPNTN